MRLIHYFLNIDGEPPDPEEIADSIQQSFTQISGMSFSELWQKFLAMSGRNIGKLGWAMFAFLIGYILIRNLIRIVRRILKRTKVDPAQHGFILSFIKIILYILLGITCVGVLGINLTPMIAAAGALGLAVSLAVKDILANIAGGISILFSRPFAKNDFVETGALSGTIIEIGMVYTTLKTADNKTIFLPNGDLSKATIINYSAQPIRRLDLVFNIRDTSDLEQAKAMMLEVAAKSPLLLKNPPPIIQISDQSFSYVQVSLLVWVNSSDMSELKSYLIGEIRKRISEEAHK